MISAPKQNKINLEGRYYQRQEEIEGFSILGEEEAFSLLSTMKLSL